MSKGIEEATELEILCEALARNLDQLLTLPEYVESSHHGRHVMIAERVFHLLELGAGTDNPVLASVGAALLNEGMNTAARLSKGVR